MVKLFEKYYYRNKRGKVVILLLVCFFLSFNCMALENDSICFLPRYELETQVSPFWFFHTNVVSPTNYPGSKKIERQLHDGFIEYLYHSQIYREIDGGLKLGYGIIPAYPLTTFPGLKLNYLLSSGKSRAIYIWSGIYYISEIDGFDNLDVVGGYNGWLAETYKYKALSVPLGIKLLLPENGYKNSTYVLISVNADVSFYKDLREHHIYLKDIHYSGPPYNDSSKIIEQNTHQLQFSRLSAYVGVGKQYFVSKRWSLSWQVSAFEPFYFRKFLFDVHYFKLGAQFGVGYTLK